MININGNLSAEDKSSISIANRGYTYGDALFETIRVHAGTILFWEDHYFRLMASMRIVRMEIPMNFTPEFLQEEILRLIEASGFMNSSVKIKIIVNRREGGLYTPIDYGIEYSISVTKLDSSLYNFSEEPYEVTLFKDHYVAPDLLSTLKSNNKLVHVLAGIFAKENGFENCLLLNVHKMVVEASNGNLFLVKDNKIKTPPVLDGCLKGVLRTQLLKIIEKLPDYEIEESSISPFELQKADELFTTNVIRGLQPITKFRKKEYISDTTRRLIGILNAQIRLNN